jgi:hypothetical protein
MFCADPNGPSPPHSPSAPCSTARAEAIAPCTDTAPPDLSIAETALLQHEPSKPLLQQSQEHASCSALSPSQQHVSCGDVTPQEDPDFFYRHFVETFSMGSLQVYCTQLKHNVMWAMLRHVHALAVQSQVGERAVTSSLIDKLCSYSDATYERATLEALHKDYTRIKLLLATGSDRRYWLELVRGLDLSDVELAARGLSRVKVECLASPAVRATWMHLSPQDRVARWHELLLCKTSKDIQARAKGQHTRNKRSSTARIPPLTLLFALSCL